MSETIAQYARRMAQGSTALRPSLLLATRATAESAAARARTLGAQRAGLRGRALAAIRSEARLSGAVAEGRVYGDQREIPFLKIHEDGGTIVARTGPYLVFRGRDGSYRRVKQVTLRGHHYIRDAALEARPELRARALAAVRATVGGSDGV